MRLCHKAKLAIESIYICLAFWYIQMCELGQMLPLDEIVNYTIAIVNLL